MGEDVAASGRKDRKKRLKLCDDDTFYHPEATAMFEPFPPSHSKAPALGADHVPVPYSSSQIEMWGSSPDGLPSAQRDSGSVPYGQITAPSVDIHPLPSAPSEFFAEAAMTVPGGLPAADRWDPPPEGFVETPAALEHNVHRVGWEEEPILASPVVTPEPAPSSPVPSSRLTEVSARQEPWGETSPSTAAAESSLEEPATPGPRSSGSGPAWSSPEAKAEVGSILDGIAEAQFFAPTPEEPTSERASRPSDGSSGPEAGTTLSVVPSVPARARGRTRLLVLPAVCLLATAAGLAAGVRVSASRQTAPIATLAVEVDGLRAAQDGERAELKKQAAALTEARDAVEVVSRRQSEAEQAAKVERARVDEEHARLGRDIAATRRAQARTDERVYKLGEALKLIDWATTGGNATVAVEATTTHEEARRASR